MMHPKNLLAHTKEWQELQALHSSCVRTLSRYIEEAKRTCHILTTVREFPVSTEVREEIRQQRELENLAYNDYLIARQKLFETAKWD
jgi:hypothetical protein